MKRFSYICLFGAIFINLGCNSNSANQDISTIQGQLLTPEQLTEDLNFLFETIDRVHPDMYAFISKDKFAKYKKNLFSKCNRPMTLHRFCKKIEPVISKLKDDHIIVYSPMANTREKQRQAVQALFDKTKSENTLNQNSYHIDEEHDVCILNFNRGGHPHELPEYKKLFREMFTEIRKRNIRKLIIDVRKNPGGYSGTGEELIRYLTDRPFRQYEKAVRKLSPQAIAFYNKIDMDIMAELHNSFDLASVELGADGLPRKELFTAEAKFVEPKPNSLRFSGSVYVLLGRWTFSSAMLFASTVQYYDIAPLIGEKTRFPFDKRHYGDVIFTELPNSHLLCQISTTIFTAVTHDKKPGTGVIPDYKVKQHSNDTKKNIDTVLQYTINMMK